MSHSRKSMNALLAGAVALAAAGLASGAQAMEPPKDKEKCYGIAKAGMNDCASADGAHNCAAAAKIDGSGVEWIGVPKGLCNRIVGGSLEPITQAAAESVTEEASSEE